MSEPNATRVLLLARAGDARDRLREAVDAAGAQIALVADPVSADPREAVAVRPQAVLVALEPAVEDALERFDGLLSDPAVTVIFEEAELAAQRAGWEAARWVRHLSAKLNRHDDVLPPGWDAERDLQPSPGPLPPPRDASGLDIAALAGEARELAGDVPRDEGPASDVRLDADAGTRSLAEADPAPAQAPPEPGYELADAPATAWSVDEAAIGESSDDELSVDALTFEAVPADGFGIDGMTGDEPLAVVSADGDGLEGDFELTDAGAFAIDGLAGDQPLATVGDHDAAAVGTPRGTLDLVDVDALFASVDALESGAPDVAAAPPATPAPEIDLDALERRVAGLSLVDVDSYGHGPERGAVVVEGGLGGPDAVRQLLAAMPEDFPRPVLVRLQLDGGRYDRLVRQMERAARLPVALAEAGQPAEPGTIYFVPPDLSIERERGRLAFVADPAGTRPLLAGLPPGDSAVLLMSGSTVGSVDAAVAQLHAGLLVAAQALDGCYDPAATNALAARGGDTGTPAELAERLAGRWPS